MNTESRPQLQSPQERQTTKKILSNFSLIACFFMAALWPPITLGASDSCGAKINDNWEQIPQSQKLALLHRLRKEMRSQVCITDFDIFEGDEANTHEVVTGLLAKPTRLTTHLCRAQVFTTRFNYRNGAFFNYHDKSIYLPPDESGGGMTFNPTHYYWMSKGKCRTNDAVSTGIAAYKLLRKGEETHVELILQNRLSMADSAYQSGAMIDDCHDPNTGEPKLHMLTRTSEYYVLIYNRSGCRARIKIEFDRGSPRITYLKLTSSEMAQQWASDRMARLEFLFKNAKFMVKYIIKDSEFRAIKVANGIAKDYLSAKAIAMTQEERAYNRSYCNFTSELRFALEREKTSQEQWLREHKNVDRVDLKNINQLLADCLAR